VKKKWIRVELALWVVAGAAGVHAMVAARRSSIPETGTGSPVPPVAPMPAEAPADSLLAWADSVTSRNPFRLSRQPSATDGMSQIDDPSAAYRPPQPPRPALALHGLVGSGGRWEAVLAGVPGRAGAVLARAGDTLGELRVRQVGPDIVVVQGMDTTWKLTLRRAWQ
jgi:hypothetical protein